MSPDTITSETTFSSKQKLCSIVIHKKCMDKFSVNFDNEVALRTDSPIFLDTNVLLRYYSISFAARKKLFDFINKNNKRIIITPQVQFELLKNRENTIQQFFEKVTSQIPKDFNSHIVNGMTTFLNEHKVILNDYPFVSTTVEKYKTELGPLLQKLEGMVNQNKIEYKDLVFQDPFLDLLSTCTLYEWLSIQETEVVKKDFDLLRKNISSENIDSLLKKPNGPFPGLADIKDKADDPYGDFIIFHEMMKFMKNNSKDVVFLTFDNTKGDWFTKGKSPLLHYVLNAFANTNQLLYITDADRTLGELLSIDIQSLVKEEYESSLIPTTPESLAIYARNCSMFEGIANGLFGFYDAEEFKINGYNFIHEIESDLIKAIDAVNEFRRLEQPTLNTVGMIRVGLRIANSKNTRSLIQWKSYELDQDSINSYAKYRYLLK